MLNRTTILIVLLGIITVVLVMVALQGQKPQPPIIKKSSPTSVILPPVEKTSTVYFSPETLNVIPNSATTVDIMVNTGKDAITGVQVELKYDPTLLTNVTINAPQDSFFGTSQDYLVLFKEVNSKDGIITYAIAISPNKNSKAGSGKVATLTFRALALPKTSVNTTISFLKDTLVTKEGVTESVLKNTTPLIITQK